VEEEVENLVAEVEPADIELLFQEEQNYHWMYKYLIQLQLELEEQEP
jgi:hypothetical protein